MSETRYTILWGWSYHDVEMLWNTRGNTRVFHRLTGGAIETLSGLSLLGRSDYCEDTQWSARTAISATTRLLGPRAGSG